MAAALETSTAVLLQGLCFHQAKSTLLEWGLSLGKHGVVRTWLHWCRTEVNGSEGKIQVHWEEPPMFPSIQDVEIIVASVTGRKKPS